MGAPSIQVLTHRPSKGLFCVKYWFQIFTLSHTFSLLQTNSGLVMYYVLLDHASSQFLGQPKERGLDGWMVKAVKVDQNQSRLARPVTIENEQEIEGIIGKLDSFILKRRASKIWGLLSKRDPLKRKYLFYRLTSSWWMKAVIGQTCLIYELRSKRFIIQDSWLHSRACWGFGNLIVSSWIALPC